MIDRISCYKRLRHGFYLLGLVTLDQWTKMIARNSFSSGRELTIIPKVLRFVFLKNEGAVWGFLSGLEHSVFYLSIATVLFMGLLVYFYFSIPDTKRYRPLLLIITFTLAGAIGNFIDRVFFHYVTDFIYFEIIHFPVFNVADCYITVSVFLACILILFYYKDNDFTPLFRKNKNKGDKE